MSSTRPVGGCCLYIKLSFVGIFVTLRMPDPRRGWWMEPPCRLVVLAGSSPRLDKLVPSGHRGGCRLLRMPGAAARLAVASPPCRYMITRPAVLDACWSRPVARWLDAGASPRLWMNNQPARLSVAEDGHRRGCGMLDPHRTPAARLYKL